MNFYGFFRNSPNAGILKAKSMPSKNNDFARQHTMTINDGNTLMFVVFDCFRIVLRELRG